MSFGYLRNRDYNHYRQRDFKSTSVAMDCGEIQFSLDIQSKKITVIERNAPRKEN